MFLPDDLMWNNLIEWPFMTLLQRNFIELSVLKQTSQWHCFAPYWEASTTLSQIKTFSSLKSLQKFDSKTEKSFVQSLFWDQCFISTGRTYQSDFPPSPSFFINVNISPILKGHSNSWGILLPLLSLSKNQNNGNQIFARFSSLFLKNGAHARVW